MRTHSFLSPARRGVAALLVVLSLATPGIAAAVDDDPFDPDPPSEEPEPEPDTRPPAVIDWQMPDRYGDDANDDGMIDSMVPADYCSSDAPSSCAAQPPTSPLPIKPDSWHVDLNACGSRYTFLPETTVSWRLLRGQGQITGGPGCWDWDLIVPTEGVYTVELTVTSPSGTATAIQDIAVQDWLIVSIGDSYGSGEGNPDIEIEWFTDNTVAKAAQWQDRRCQRSAHAGSAQAARRIESIDRRTSVTFIHVACSGAEALSGLLQGYAGVSESPEAQRMGPIPPQLSQARAGSRGERSTPCTCRSAATTPTSPTSSKPACSSTRATHASSGSPTWSTPTSPCRRRSAPRPRSSLPRSPGRSVLR